MEEAVFRSLKRACYAGLDSITLRRELAARIAPAVPWDAYAFSTTDPDTGLLTHMVAEGVPEPLLAAYSAHFYPHQGAIITLDMLQAGEVVCSMAERAPEIRSALRASGLRYQAHVNLALGESLWGTWCLLRQGAAEAERRRARAFLERIAPHVARALQAAALVDRGLQERTAAGAGPSRPEAEAGAISPAAASLPGTPAVVVLDARGHPLVRTGAAALYLDDLADVGVPDPDHIPLGIRNAVARARARLARPEVAAGAAPGDVLLRARGRSGRWYTARAMLAEPESAGAGTAVVVVQPSTPRERALILSRLYDLSQREREVTAAVARGDSTKRIAARLGVSPHTVKEHLDRACGKIGVRGRKALVAKLFFDGYAPVLAERRRALTPPLPMP